MDVSVTHSTSYLVVLLQSGMESLISVFYRMDTLSHIIYVDIFTLVTCITIAGSMYLNSYLRKIILKYISTLVPILYLIPRAIVKKDAEETPVCSQGAQGFKKRARLDNSDDVPTQRDESVREDSLEFSTSDNSDEVLPESPDSPKKTRRRQKKKRYLNKSKYKNMDDSSETSSNSDQSTKSEQVKPTKVYSPILLYQQLNLDDISLYREFENYILNREQLRFNGFPEESPMYPGKAVVKQRGKVERGSTKRTCCRCTTIFQVHPDGKYEAKEPCHYHLRRQIPFGFGHSYQGDFPCCNGNYLSKGCMTWQYHVTQESSLDDVDFVKTKRKRHLSKEKACNVYAIDCEMVYTTAGMEVAKVGVVGINGLTIYESFVLPQNPILDYNTLYSGVTEKDLKDISMTLGDVQAYLLKLLNVDSILVGHGLENDLKALRLIHEKVVDTSVVFPHPQTKRHKQSLKNLAREFLNKSIQASRSGHNCIEDARTCLELMLGRIKEAIKERPFVTQDENKNSVLENSIDRIPHFPILPPLTTIKFDMTCSMWHYDTCKCMNYDVHQTNIYCGLIFPNNIHRNSIY